LFALAPYDCSDSIARSAARSLAHVETTLISVKPAAAAAATDDDDEDEAL